MKAPAGHDRCRVPRIRGLKSHELERQHACSVPRSTKAGSPEPWMPRWLLVADEVAEL